MPAHAQNALDALRSELQEIDSTISDNLKKTVSSYQASKRHCNETIQFLLTHQFKDLTEQIAYFKTIKPEIFSHLFYYRKVLEIENCSLGKCINERKRILIEELSRKTIFFDSHLELYSYFKKGKTECDEKYFSKLDRPELRYTSSEECMFSTHDIIFAKFMAYEQVEIYLTDELQKILAANRKEKPGTALQKIKQLGIEWTSTDRDLVELIYGLFLLRCINHGNVRLTKIVEGVNIIFNTSFSINEFYNIGSQLRYRKKGNEVSFFERLRHAVAIQKESFLK